MFNFDQEDFKSQINKQLKAYESINLADDHYLNFSAHFDKEAIRIKEKDEEVPQVVNHQTLNGSNLNAEKKNPTAENPNDDYKAFNDQKVSTNNEDSLSESRRNQVASSQNSLSSSVSDRQESHQKHTVNSKKSEEVSKADEEVEEVRNEDDPDFCYTAPRKQKFEYNKRKDVILKTILRKCRRVLQDEFNELTQYYQHKKLQGHQFLKDCVTKYFDFLQDKPQQLDLSFYIGAMLYPQEMSRGVDCFFDCDKKDRVKQRKLFRAKIQKVHDVLYRYSHEKMEYFINVPELSYLYTLFYK